MSIMLPLTLREAFLNLKPLFDLLMEPWSKTSGGQWPCSQFSLKNEATTTYGLKPMFVYVKHKGLKSF